MPARMGIVAPTLPHLIHLNRCDLDVVYDLRCESYQIGMATSVMLRLG